MSAVAGLFAREVGETLLQNFSVGEMVIENGGDIQKQETLISIKNTMHCVPTILFLNNPDLACKLRTEIFNHLRCLRIFSRS